MWVRALFCALLLIQASCAEDAPAAQDANDASPLNDALNNLSNDDYSALDVQDGVTTSDFDKEVSKSDSDTVSNSVDGSASEDARKAFIRRPTKPIVIKPIITKPIIPIEPGPVPVKPWPEVKPCPECDCMKWTPWIDADNPSGLGDYETLRHPKDGYGTYITDSLGRPGNVARMLAYKKIVCNHPIQIECREKTTGKPFHLAGDDTKFPRSLKCTTDQGLACVNKYQQDGKCKDYEVRVLCWSACKTLRWTKVVSRDTQSGVGDFEGHHLADHPVRNYEPCPRGGSPYEIDCVYKYKNVYRSALLSNQRNLMCDKNWGFACVNSKQSNKRCNNYGVRYLCKV